MPSSIQRIQLTSQSYEWSQVDYQLQVATGKSSLKLLTVHKYDDKNTAQSLDYKSTHTAMINVTDFSKEYSDKLIEKTLSLEDVVFKCGHINIQKFIANQHKIITFLICKVYLGKIGHNNDPDVTQCDSIFIQPQTTQDVFQFNYFLRSAAQYSIQYEVTFTTSQQKQFKLQQFQCSACQNRIPTLYCKTQNLFFCQNCCNQHHKSKLMATHQLELINKINTLGHCKNHNQKLQYYCMKCVKYLCGQCVQKGVHHQNSEHPFEKVDILYEEKRQTVEDVAKRPKEKLGTLMVNLGLKRKQIDQNYALVKQSITKKYQNALQVLNQIYYEKCQTLTSCQTEIKMLTEKIQWSKAFIVFEEKNLKPLHYFESQKKFEQDLSKLKIAEFEGIFTTKPDIKLEGDFVVGTQDNIDHYRKKLQQQGQTNSQNTSYEKGLSGVYKYKPTGEKPKIGDLTLMLQNTKLNFFQGTCAFYHSCGKSMNFPFKELSHDLIKLYLLQTFLSIYFTQYQPFQQQFIFEPYIQTVQQMGNCQIKSNQNSMSKKNFCCADERQVSLNKKPKRQQIYQQEMSKFGGGLTVACNPCTGCIPRPGCQLCHGCYCFV